MANLTQSFVDKAPRPNEGQVIYFDDNTKGFGLRVTAGGKSYIVQSRVNGRVIRYKIGTSSAWSCKQAEAEAKRFLLTMSQGIDPNAQKHQQKVATITLEEVFTQYKQDKKLRPATLDIYEGAMRRCFDDWRQLPITEITKDMVLRRHQKISNANGPRGKGEAHANQVMRFLRALYNYAAITYEVDGNALVIENPVRRLSQLRAWNRIPRRQDVIRPHELRPWYEAVLALPNPTIRDYLILCLFTGLRRSEAAKLTWYNVDLTAKTLSIPREDTKTYEQHVLPLPDVIYEMLYRREQDPKRSLTYVFPGKNNGSPLIESKWSVTKVARQSGIKFSPHTLRRTFETIAESLDLSHYALKRLLNHKTTSDVTSGYIVVQVERLREPMQRIADVIKKNAGIKSTLLLEGSPG